MTGMCAPFRGRVTGAYQFDGTFIGPTVRDGRELELCNDGGLWVVGIIIEAGYKIEWIADDRFFLEINYNDFEPILGRIGVVSEWLAESKPDLAEIGRQAIAAAKARVEIKSVMDEFENIAEMAFSQNMAYVNVGPT